MRTRENFIDWARLSRWQPLLSYEPVLGNEISISGMYQLNAILDQSIEVHDSFHIRTVIPENYRIEPPRILELDRKIPWEADMNIETDGKICLAAPLELKIYFGKDKCLVQYLKHFLDSYLARATIAVRKGLNRIEGTQLSHGLDGIKEDLQKRRGLTTLDQVDEVIRLLPMKKRIAGE